jgi:hypothetical protein
MWAAIGVKTTFNPDGALQFPFNDEGVGRAAGDYGLYVMTYDMVGNTRVYGPGELAQMGFPSVLHNGP